MFNKNSAKDVKQFLCSSVVLKKWWQQILEPNLDFAYHV